jgi:acetyl esterase
VVLLLAGVRCITYRPVDVSGPLPTLVYFHGGGYVVGAPEWWDTALTSISHDLKIAVVNVDYPLAPEVRQFTLRWLLQSG